MEWSFICVKTAYFSVISLFLFIVNDDRIHLECYFAAALTNLSCILALLFWKPDPGQLPLFFVFPGLWGMADAIWQTQTNGSLKSLNLFNLNYKL